MTDNSKLPLTRWRWTAASVKNVNDWAYINIPIDLDGAVTLTATMAATFREPSYGPTAHEEQLEWELRDSLDGQSWHTIATGCLTPNLSAGIIRVASPLGTSLRLYLRLMLIRTAYVGSTVSQRIYCPDECNSREHTPTVADAVLNVAIRSI